MKKIFAFSTNPNGGEGTAIALAEDGVVLGTHWCGHDSFVPYDLGVIDNYRPDRHEIYKKHFPEGYIVIFVHAGDVPNNKELQVAMLLAAMARALPNDENFAIKAGELL